MEYYNQTKEDITKVYTQHDTNNKETKNATGVSDNVLKDAYDNALKQIDDEKKIFVGKRGIYKYLSSEMSHKKFNSNLLNHLNNFEHTTKPILSVQTIQNIHDVRIYEKDKLIEEKKRLHTNLLRSHKAVFLAGDGISNTLNKKRFSFF